MTSLNKRVLQNLRGRGVTVYTRRQWGSLSPHTYAFRRVFRRHKILPKNPVDTVWQHITVTKDTGRDHRTFKNDMRTLEKIGNERFGSGISYNFAVDMVTGEVGVGQPLDAAGTHTLNDKHVATPSGKPLSFNQNYVSISIAFIGMPGAVPSEKAIGSVTRLLRALKQEGVITESFDYLPHSWVAPKDCPTQPVRDVMPRIRGNV